MAEHRWVNGQGAVGKRIGREKMRTKRSVLTDMRGVPLSIVLSGANTHDVKLLEQTLDAVEVERPNAEAMTQHLCADGGDVGTNAEK